MENKRIIASALALLFATQTFSFCGFYVAKADATLFNIKSEVIFVRKGDQSTVTMSSDFQGEVKDFAMVVPVPVVLRRNDIKVVNRDLFSKLDSYSAPRLVEYYDQNPCAPIYTLEESLFRRETNAVFTDDLKAFSGAAENEVTIEAEYQVENYDILILSAKESNGLKTWLTTNGYKIPNQAEEVLAPYIKSGMKFFVVKVNMERHAQSQQRYLNPLQISFESPKFMLPIRLGMANSAGEQDMIMYFLTDQGRVETTNYRTVELPSNKNIPLYAKSKFGEMYKDVFDKQYNTQNKNAIFLEYAWNVSPNWGGMKCDPCVGDPPIVADLKESGVDWANGNNLGEVYFTRMHVRYSRDKFPQDLQFQVTPNKQNYQVRYILTHPANGDLSCDEGKKYIEKLNNRRKTEVEELAALTGWETGPEANAYLNKYQTEKKENSSPLMVPIPQQPNQPKMLLIFCGVLMLFVGVSYRILRWKPRLDLAHKVGDGYSK